MLFRMLISRRPAYGSSIFIISSCDFIEDDTRFLEAYSSFCKTDLTYRSKCLRDECLRLRVEFNLIGLCCFMICTTRLNFSLNNSLISKINWRFLFICHQSNVGIREHFLANPIVIDLYRVIPWWGASTKSSCTTFNNIASVCFECSYLTK